MKIYSGKSKTVSRGKNTSKEKKRKEETTQNFYNDLMKRKDEKPL